MSEAVVVENLRKVFRDIVTIDGISFSVKPGEVFGLVGPNGAGKTTTPRILATILKPTEGTVLIYGMDVVKEKNRVRRIISYLPEEAGAYKNMTG